jgi:type III restriction enzyme
MSAYEVPQPILNSPFKEPKEHWHIVEGETPEQRPGRRPSMYFYRDPKVKPEKEYGTVAGTAIELKLVNRIRAHVKKWRSDGYPGVTRTTHELLQWWRRDGRAQRLFFAQLDAVETIIFLIEARGDLRQGIDVPQEEISAEKRAQGFAGFRRCASKMATGSGKTTVMGMLAAWSILNKVNDRSDARFSDVVLNDESPCHLILETKGYDPLEEVKRRAADRWVAAVNADGTHGHWHFSIAKKVSDIPSIIERATGKE